MHELAHVKHSIRSSCDHDSDDEELFECVYMKDFFSAPAGGVNSSGFWGTIGEMWWNLPVTPQWEQWLHILQGRW